MGAWRVTKVVRFAHCDPAGIVYYPRYFELLHEAKEDWLRDAVGVPLGALIDGGHGLPMVRLETDFLAPSRLGETLDIDVDVARVGGASLHLHYEVACGGEQRLRAKTVVVHIRLDSGRPVPFDDALRARLARVGTPGEAR
jgi:4-hydroxybenzoyl-CoA thioesterase